MGQSRRQHQKEARPALKVIPDLLDLLDLLDPKALLVPQ
jgi:hypothetical protein